jgi:hypothetical protein
MMETIYTFDEPDYIVDVCANNYRKLQYKINENGCWVVTNFFVNKDGYTHVKRYNKRIGSHRWVYENFYKTSIPKGKVVRHKCDNPTCINPEHLEIGTQTQNTRDTAQRNRTAKGQAVGTANLTKEEYETIKQLIKKGYTRNAIKDLTGRNAFIVQKIADNVHWSCKVYDPTRRGKIQLVTKYANQPKGRNHLHASLTKAQFNKIEDMYNNGSAIIDISKEIGINRQAIRQIVNGTHWSCKEYGEG